MSSTISNMGSVKYVFHVIPYVYVSYPIRPSIRPNELGFGLVWFCVIRATPPRLPFTLDRTNERTNDRKVTLKEEIAGSRTSPSPWRHARTVRPQPQAAVPVRPVRRLGSDAGCTTQAQAGAPLGQLGSYHALPFTLSSTKDATRQKCDGCRWGPVEPGPWLAPSIAPRLFHALWPSPLRSLVASRPTVAAHRCAPLNLLLCESS
jgi:hypothetical protein